MTEQCPLCGKEKIDGQDYCVTSGCGWHFRNDASLNLIPTPEHSDIQSDGKLEEDKKEMEKEQEPSKSEPEFFKERDEKPSDESFVQSESQWEKERKEMEAEADATAPGYNAQIVDVNESQGILVLPGGKEIPVQDNPITVGRNDVSEHVEFKIGEDPRKVSSQQFTIWRESGQYFIEDRQTSVQTKQSTNGTKVNGKNISGELKKELHDSDKIEFACISGCIATFQVK